MWITNGGALAYFSEEENRRVILFDAAHLCICQVNKLDWSIKPCCFELEATSIDGSRRTECVFGCESHKDYVDWVRKLRSAVNLDCASIDLATGIFRELTFFKEKLRGLRGVGVSECVGFGVHFKGQLWKVRIGGDKRIANDWILMDMWLTKNGSFMYWSTRYHGEMVWYTEDDVASATFELTPEGVTARPYAFRVSVPALDDFVVAPADDFAAPNSECMSRWLCEFQKFGNSSYLI